MGQYHHAVNLDKREYINPHDIGLGLKQWEQVSDRMALCLIGLLSCSNGRGGGDLPVVDGISGRWAGDRIAFVGDYSEAGDIAGYDGIEHVYGLCDDDAPDHFTDITPQMASFIEEAEDGMFVGDGWKQWVPNGGRVCRWPDSGNEKLHGTVTKVNRKTRHFSVRWDGAGVVDYGPNSRSVPYLMASDVPAPAGLRLVVSK